jgi:hypothetical protein
VADVLVRHPAGLPVACITKETGIEVGKLGRILRFLATKHCFHEGTRLPTSFTELLTKQKNCVLVRPDVFANNRLSLLLVSSTPLADRLLLSTTVTFGPADKFHACLTDLAYGPSMSPEKSPFMYNVKNEGLKDFFDYMKHHVRRPANQTHARILI